MLSQILDIPAGNCVNGAIATSLFYFGEAEVTMNGKSNKFRVLEDTMGEGGMRFLRIQPTNIYLCLEDGSCTCEAVDHAVGAGVLLQ